MRESRAWVERGHQVVTVTARGLGVVDSPSSSVISSASASVAATAHVPQELRMCHELFIACLFWTGWGAALTLAFENVLGSGDYSWQSLNEKVRTSSGGGDGTNEGAYGLALLPGVQFDFVFSSVLLMTVGGASVEQCIDIERVASMSSCFRDLYNSISPALPRSDLLYFSSRRHSGLHGLCHCHRHCQSRAASAARVVRRPLARSDDCALRVEHAGTSREEERGGERRIFYRFLIL
jgi:hypothetical protein